MSPRLSTRNMMSSTLMGALEVGSSAAPTERLIKKWIPVSTPDESVMRLWQIWASVLFNKLLRNPDEHRMLANKPHGVSSNNFQTATSWTLVSWKLVSCWWSFLTGLFLFIVNLRWIIKHDVIYQSLKCKGSILFNNSIYQFQTVNIFKYFNKC